MRQAGVVTRLAVRELWITFRMLLVLVAFVVAGAAVALLPAAPAVSLERAAIGLALATVVTSSLSAWTLADERTSGRSGWLVMRSVSRGTYLVGWFVALSGISLLGAAAAGTLAWMAASAAAPAMDVVELVTGMLGIAASVCAAVALGLAAGAIARPWIAAAGAATACLLAGAFAVVLPSLAPVLPGGAFVALPRLLSPDAGVGAGLRAAGVGLVAAAILLGAARAAMERAEL